MMRMLRLRLVRAQRGAGRGIRAVLRWVLSFHGRPRDIALGAAIGMAVAFTPTIGLQIVVAVFLATLVGASRAAAIVPVWITNPFTFVPIYGFTYMLGSWFWPGEVRGDIRQRLGELWSGMDRYDLWDLADRLRLLMAVGWDLFMPMMIGGLLLGLVLAVPTYFATLWTVNHARAFIPRRRPGKPSVAQFAGDATTRPPER
jgi:uncharacterized protein (DUF2062 family)